MTTTLIKGTSVRRRICVLRHVVLMAILAMICGDQHLIASGQTWDDSDDLESHLVPVDKQQRIKILKDVATAIRENRSKIRSWEGAFRFQDESSLSRRQAEQMLGADNFAKLGSANRIVKKDKGTGSFVVDDSVDSLFVEFRADPSVFRGLPDGTQFEAESNTRFWQKSVLTPEHYLHLQPESVYGQFEIAPQPSSVHSRVGFRDPVSAAANQDWGFLIDPRKIFDYSRRFDEEFDLYVAALESGNEDADDSIRVLQRSTARGMRYRFEMSGGIGQDAANRRLTFRTSVSEDVGFNPVKVEVLKDGNSRHFMRWHYKKHQDIFVPDSVFKMIATPDGEYVAFQRALSIETKTLNRDVAPSTFTMEVLGMANGDRWLDRIENKAFAWKDGNLGRIEAGQAVTPAGRSYTMAILIGLNVVFLLVIIVLLRRRARDIQSPA